MQRWTTSLPRTATAPCPVNPRRRASRLDVSTSAWRQTRQTTFSTPSCSPLSSQLAARWYTKQGHIKGQEQRSNSHDPSRDPALADYVEAKVDDVRENHGSGTSVVYLRVQDELQHCLAVYIGEFESKALQRERSKEHKPRPLTHDVTKDLLAIIGYRVTKVRITEIVNDTYYARIHIAPLGDAAGEQDVDARPSDAINLAVRFKAPIYIRRKIAALAQPYPPPTAVISETHTQIAASVREVLAEFEDPTVMDTLHKELAVHEQRFKDAHVFQQRITHEMTHNRLLRLVVAMESALADLRYEEAARLRDEYRQLSALQRRQTAGANANSSGVDREMMA